MIYIEVLCSFIKIIFLKIVNGKRLQISPIQILDKSLMIKSRNSSRIIIRKGMKCRRNCSIRCEHGKVEFNEGVFLNENVSITALESITIGKNVTIANNVVIVDHDHDYKKLSGEAFLTSPVCIGDECLIGANSIILKGAILGERCVVAAGTVVRAGKYPNGSLIFNPKSTEIKIMRE